jgi:hypothetical protein
MIERIERLSQPNWAGFSRYIQEVKRPKKSVEGIDIIIDDAIEMMPKEGQRINYLV